MEKNHINAMYEGRALVLAPTSLDIREHIQVKSLTDVLRAGKPSVRAPPWQFTKGHTQERDLINAPSVVSASVRALTLSGTREPHRRKALQMCQL